MRIPSIRVLIGRSKAIVVVAGLMLGTIFMTLAPVRATDPHRVGRTLPPGMWFVTVTSKPVSARIYIDDIEVGRTPMTFPMPAGGYTLFLQAPGHQSYWQRIHVPDAPLHVNANLIPIP